MDVKLLDENSSINFDYEDGSDLVYFMVNIEQLLGVNLSFPGIRSALKKAYLDSKQVTPIDTGLMRRSYTIEYVSTNRAILFFDPHKIIGKKRLGRIVKTYYPKYLHQKRSTYNWMDVLMLTFYRSLMNSVKEINKINREKIKQEEKKQKWKESEKKASDVLKLLALTEFIKALKENQKEKLRKEDNHGT